MKPYSMVSSRTTEGGAASGRLSSGEAGMVVDFGRCRQSWYPIDGGQLSLSPPQPNGSLVCPGFQLSIPLIILSRDGFHLVQRRFPFHKILQVPTPLTSRGGVKIAEAERKRRLQEVEEYRAALKAKTPEELRALFEEEKKKENEESRLKVEREERERFFNRPQANADFEHWSKAVYWTLDEALALAFGKSPETVTWGNVQPYVNVSHFARQFARVRDLAIRAKKWNQLFDPVMPGIFLAWARRMEIDLAQDLVKAVEARGIVVADWKDIHDQLRLQFDKLLEDRDKIAEVCRELIEERNALRARVAQLEQEAAAWQFDESSENYPSELDIAMQAWWAVSRNRNSTGTVKQQLLAWLERNYPKLTEEAKERIATVCNWGKRGGRPAQS